MEASQERRRTRSSGIADATNSQSQRRPLSRVSKAAAGVLPPSCRWCRNSAIVSVIRRDQLTPDNHPVVGSNRVRFCLGRSQPDRTRPDNLNLLPRGRRAGRSGTRVWGAAADAEILLPSRFA